MTNKKFSLSQSEINQFRENGFLGPFDLYTPEEMADIHKKVRAGVFNREFAAYNVPLDSPPVNYDRHLDVPLLGRHIGRPEIVDRICSLYGDDLMCWRSEFFPKYPGDEGTDWHQVDSFAHATGEPQIVWPIQGEFGAGTITAWTAFTDVTVETGCLMMIPGTHKKMNYDESKGMKYDPELRNSSVKEGKKMGFFGYDYRSLQIDPDWKPDESKAQHFEMKAGQFILFLSTVCHASMPNVSEKKMRLGYACRYLPSYVYVYPGTDRVEEYEVGFSLENYGTIIVAGNNLQPENRQRDKNLRGQTFRSLWQQ